MVFQILRTVSKVGRDTRYPTHGEAVRVLRRNLDDLPGKLRLESARRLAEWRVETLRTFLAALEEETEGVDL